MKEYCIINLNNASPLVTAAIHDGHKLSENLLQNSALTDSERLREEDPHTGYWAKISDNHIIGQRSRFEFDLNRSPDKAIYILPSDAWGLNLWKKTPSEQSIASTLERYTAVYQGIYEGLSSLIEQHGKIVILDLHSYNHRRGGPNAPYDDPRLNPEINVGTGTMDRVYWSSVVDRFIDELGSIDFLGKRFDVRENIKFKGGYFPTWVHRNFKESACCISVEMKKVFMDEWSGKPDYEAIEAIKSALTATLPGIIEEITKKRTLSQSDKFAP